MPLEIVGQKSKRFELRQRPDRPEISAIERENRIGLIFSGNDDVDRIGQVEIKIEVLPSDVLSEAEHPRGDVRNLRTLSLQPSSKIVDGVHCLRPTELPRCEVIELGQKQR